MEQRDSMKDGFDPKKMKVAQLRRVLTENSVQFPNNSKKSVLVKLFNAELRDRGSDLKGKYFVSSQTDGDAGSDKTDESQVDVEETVKLSQKRKHDDTDNSDTEGVYGKGPVLLKKSGKASRENTPKKRKKRKQESSERETSLITEKVSKKTPVKSPNKSLNIEKFESDSSSDSFENNKSNVSSGKLNDFSYQRKALAPDLTKMKVSPEFSLQIQHAMKENEKMLAQSELVGKSSTTSNTPRKKVKSSSSTPKKIRERSLSSTPSKMNKSSGKKDAVKAEVKEPVTSDVKAEHLHDKKLDEVIYGLSPPIIQKKTKRARIGCKGLLTFFTILVPMFAGLWYREQRIEIGYCGSETKQDISIFPNAMVNAIPALGQVDEFLEDYKPSCIPCPRNAVCYPRMKLRCKPEYNLVKNNYSLFGLIPLPDKCLKNGEKEKQVQEMVQKALNFLEKKNSELNCGEGNDDKASGITEQELYDIFHESKAPWISHEEFDELWAQAVQILKDEKEITWRQLYSNEEELQRNDGQNEKANDIQVQKRYLHKEDGQPKSGLFRSTSKKYIGLRCKFEREIYQTYLKFRIIFWSLVSLVVALKVIDYKYKKYHAEQKVIANTTKEVQALLKKRKLECLNSNEKPYVSAIQLRDVFLSSIHGIKQRNVIWNKVVHNIEHNNSNIKSSLSEIHGEIMKCWEWIGPTKSDDHHEIESKNV